MALSREVWAGKEKSGVNIKITGLHMMYLKSSENQVPEWSSVTVLCPGPGLFKLEGAGVELVIGTLLAYQEIVGAPLYDAALLQDYDRVGVHDG